MKSGSFILAAVGSVLLFSGCNAEGPIAAAGPTRSTAVANTGTIDPAIPALTVVGRRMSAFEKVTYDQATQMRIASIRSVE